MESVYVFAGAAFTCGVVLYIMARVLERRWQRYHRNEPNAPEMARSYMIGRLWAVALMIIGAVVVVVALALQFL